MDDMWDPNTWDFLKPQPRRKGLSMEKQARMLLDLIDVFVNETGDFGWQEKRDMIKLQCSEQDTINLYEFVSWFTPDETDE